VSTKDVNDKNESRALPEHPTLYSTDALHARNASAEHIAATETKRTNASDGSLRDRATPVAEQLDSIHIVGANGTSASRTNKLSEKELAEKKNPLSKSISVIELLSKPEKSARALIEEFGRIANMPAGHARDTDLQKVQQLADKTYNRGQFADQHKLEEIVHRPESDPVAQIQKATALLMENAAQRFGTD
jgi:hypothetical protein